VKSKLSSIVNSHLIGCFSCKIFQTSFISFFLLVLLLIPFATSASVRLDIQSLPLSEKLAKKGFEAPLNAMIPAIDGMNITWARYRKYEESSFRAGREKLSAEGRYWKLEYKPYGKGQVDISVVADAYLRLLEQRAATVMMGRKGRDFLFEVTTADHKYTGKLRTHSGSISIEMIEAEAFKQTLKIDPDKLRAELMSSGKVTLEGVYFDFDKATLQPRSEQAIKAAVVLLRKYPDLELEVQGHTDAKGSADYNQKLSQRRAASVVKAIVERGVERKRLTSKGYGPTQPVASNDNEAGRAKNRRVELHRISGGELKALIGIDFIKPIPGAVEKQRWHYDHEENIIRYRKPYADKRSKRAIVGSVERIQWRFEKSGKVDRSVSAKEIIKNYLGVLELLGATITAVEKNSLYFHLANRGDGREAYGIIRTASSGTYQVSFILPAAKSVGAPAKKTEKQKSDEVAARQMVSKKPQRQDIPKVVSKQITPKITMQPNKSAGPKGKWFFDEKATRAGTSPDTDLRQYAGTVIDLMPDGVLKYNGMAAGKWKFENGEISASRDQKSWEPAPMQMVNGVLTMHDGKLKLLFSRKPPRMKVETAKPQVQQSTESAPKHPWTLDSIMTHMSKLKKLEYGFENIQNIQDTRTWHIKFEAGKLLFRLYSKNQNGGEFIDSDWVYFDAKAGDASNGPLVSNGSRSRKKMKFEAAPKTTVPAGTFDCTKVYTHDRYGDPVEAWLINDMPGVPAKIVTHKATYQLERIYP
jgi:outer membrane protein OmpA-like peptidoglycan-associated protein